jgi:hypothetical protein
MEVCQSCGKPRGPGTVFCTGCGQRFTPAESAVSKRRPSRPRRGPPISLIAIVAAVVIVAIGTGVFFLMRPGPQHIRNVADSGLSSPVRSATRAAQSPASQAAQGSGSAPPTISSAPPAASSAPPTTPSAVATPSPTPSPTPDLSTVESVTVSASAAQNPDATAVATFASQYFSAINSHSFQAYYSLLTPEVQRGLTAQSFSSGYESSTDSDETLVAITTAANGDTAANLTFTSHQSASQAAGHTGTCTDWNITLFLESNGTGYLDGTSPSSYHAKYKYCP